MSQKNNTLALAIVTVILIWAFFVQPALAWVMNNLLLLSMVVAVIIAVAYYVHKSGLF